MQRLKKNVDMTEGPFLKKMIIFAIPIIISGLLQCFYNAADLIIIGQFRGDVTVAAVGSTGAITSLCVSLFLGLSVGAGVCVAHHIGAGEEHEVKKVLHTSVMLAAILSTVVAIAGFFSAGYLLELMDTPIEVLPYATAYLRIVFLGVPGSMLYNYLSAILRSSGDSTRPLVFLAVSGVANLGLNIFLVVVFGMGVEGVAIGTIASQYLSAIMALVYLAKNDGMLHFSIKDLRIHVGKLRKILMIGIPSGINSALFGLSNVLIQASINSFGDQVVAGSSAEGNLEGFIYIAMNAIYHVTITFVGQSVGARKYKNIRRLVLYSCAIVTAVGILSAILLILFRGQLIGLYVSSEEAVAAALDRLWIIAPTYFLCGLMEVFCATLRALDRSVLAMIISLCGACGLRILWLETVFKLYCTPQTVYLSYPVTWIVTCVTYVVFIIITAKKFTEHRPIVAVELGKQEQGVARS